MNLDLLLKRKSVRSYSHCQIPENLRNILRAEVTDINTHQAGLNFQIIFDDDEPFKGFTRSYGMFRNVRNYLACVIDPSFHDTYERAGFYAEQFAIKAVELGLGTCFVGGTYSADNVNAQMHVYEKIPFIMAFGYASDKTQTILSSLTIRMSHRHNLKPRDFFKGEDQMYSEALRIYPFLEKGLKGLACAPSSLNRQPVRITLDKRKQLTAFTVGEDQFNPVNLGIGKFNFSFAADTGEWEWGENAPFCHDI